MEKLLFGVYVTTGPLPRQTIEPVRTSPGEQVPPWAATSLHPDSGGIGPRGVGGAVGADEMTRENEGKRGEKEQEGGRRKGKGKEERKKKGKGRNRDEGRRNKEQGKGDRGSGSGQNR